MPFTLAHPAAILPFTKCKRHFHLPAMILGSMAPDFEYFLRGRPSGIYGHTLWGMFLLDLPLVAVVYLIGKNVIWKSLAAYLPRFMQEIEPHKFRGRIFSFLIFCYSALIGIFTHIAWDSFTHADGAMVKRIAVLKNAVHLFHFEIPVYKLLQHGSTLLGLTVIVCFFLRAYRHQEKTGSDELSLKRKCSLWLMFAGMILLIFAVWGLVSAVSITDYGTWVIRLGDSAIVSLLLLSLLVKLRFAIKRRLTK